MARAACICVAAALAKNLPHRSRENEFTDGRVYFSVKNTSSPLGDPPNLFSIHRRHETLLGALTSSVIKIIPCEKYQLHPALSGSCISALNRVKLNCYLGRIAGLYFRRFGKWAGNRLRPCGRALRLFSGSAGWSALAFASGFSSSASGGGSPGRFSLANSSRASAAAWAIRASSSRGSIFSEREPKRHRLYTVTVCSKLRRIFSRS